MFSCGDVYCCHIFKIIAKVEEKKDDSSSSLVEQETDIASGRVINAAHLSEHNSAVKPSPAERFFKMGRRPVSTTLTAENPSPGRGRQKQQQPELERMKNRYISESSRRRQELMRRTKSSTNLFSGLNEKKGSS